MKKKILFTILVGMLVLTTACGKKDKPEEPKIEGEVANTNEGVIKDVTIDGLKIHNVTLIYDSRTGNSTFGANVTNTTGAPIDVKSFNISLRDASGNEVDSLLGYIGQVLEPNQTFSIVSGSGLDLGNVTSVEYTRNY